MKKSYILLISVVLVASLILLSVILIRDSKKSNSEMLEFAVSDVSIVDKIIITDKDGVVMEVRKTDTTWTDKKGGCLPQEPVKLLLEAFSTIRFKSYSSAGAHKSILNRMTAQNIKVEIFENGTWTKTWYIGDSTPDHLGQNMLLETAKDGKSDLPVVMSLNGLNGFIEPRFYADPRKWVCSQIFEIPLNNIKKVDINYPNDPLSNFTIDKFGMKFKVTQNGKPFAQIDTMNVFKYLHNYQKIHYNLANYELSKKQIDSLKRSQPFCKINVLEINGKKTYYPLHYVKAAIMRLTNTGDTLKYDASNCWTFLSTGEPVKCQFYVLNPLIQGHVYFPALGNTGSKVIP